MSKRRIVTTGLVAGACLCVAAYDFGVGLPLYGAIGLFLGALNAYIVYAELRGDEAEAKGGQQG